MEALADVLGRAPTAQTLLDRYTRLALVVDEVINEVRRIVEGGAVGARGGRAGKELG